MTVLKFFIFLAFIPLANLMAYDLTVVGTMNQADGLGRISIGIIDTLCDELNINFIPLGQVKYDDINKKVKRTISKPCDIPGNVAIFTHSLAWPPLHFFQFLPNSKIKIAYSMFESTRIPSEWVKILNEHFDAVVVPDPFLVIVYKDSGVKIPIFMIPLGLDLEKFLNNNFSPSKKNLKDPFVFGSTLTYVERKNFKLLIQAFKEEFGENPDVLLHIHGRFGEHKIKDLPSNIRLSEGFLSENEYFEMMSSWNCYVNLSKGEGFSIGPREAIALAIPCILSNNTAHKTICKGGFTQNIPSLIKEKATCFNEVYNSQDIGYQFNCNISEVRKSFRYVYKNYEDFLEKAALGKKWVKRYLWSKLKNKYLNLIKPKTIILGSENIVKNDSITTNSKKLYLKYIKIKKLNNNLDENVSFYEK